MRYAVLFPGQGSQFVGMGADLFRLRPDLLGDAADGVLGWGLEELCLRGPAERLTGTEYAQPAIFALSYALWSELQDHVPAPAAAAGHSLGEYTALAAAGAFSYEAGLALVAARGRAMAAAARVEPSAMAALLGADAATAARIAQRRRAEGGKLWVANDNAPGQMVVAGGAADIAWLAAEGRRLGVRRVVKLEVAGGFHSPFMSPAAAELGDALAAAAAGAPAFPVWANVTAAPHNSNLEDALQAQLTSPVLFTDTLRGMAAAEIETFVHVGPGDVTAGMARRTVPEARVLTVSSPADIDNAAGELLLG